MPDDPLPSPRGQRDDEWATLSWLADGEAPSDAQERCLSLWAERADARERWRHYQLIGDVLRSRELAREGAHDAAFLAALRARLAREPVVLRPRSGPSVGASGVGSPDGCGRRYGCGGRRGGDAANGTCATRR